MPNIGLLRIVRLTQCDPKVNKVSFTSKNAHMFSLRKHYFGVAYKRKIGKDLDVFSTMAGLNGRSAGADILAQGQDSN